MAQAFLREFNADPTSTGGLRGQIKWAMVILILAVRIMATANPLPSLKLAQA